MTDYRYTLVLLTLAAVITVAVGWFLLTAFLSSAQYIEAVL